MHRHTYIEISTCTGTGTHEPPTMHPHDAHLSGSDVRPLQSSRLSVVSAVRSPSLRASERQSHSARARAIVVTLVLIMPKMGDAAQPYVCGSPYVSCVAYNTQRSLLPLQHLCRPHAVPPS